MINIRKVATTIGGIGLGALVLTGVTLNRLDDRRIRNEMESFPKVLVLPCRGEGAQALSARYIGDTHVYDAGLRDEFFRRDNTNYTGSLNSGQEYFIRSNNLSQANQTSP